MLLNKQWYVKDSKLYRPKTVRNELLVIWFYIIFTITLYFLEPVTNFPYGFYVMWFLIAIVIINFYKNYRKFGFLGHPVLSFAKDKMTIYGRDYSSEIVVYDDDDIYIVGLKNNRFVRFVNKK